MDHIAKMFPEIGDIPMYLTTINHTCNDFFAIYSVWMSTAKNASTSYSFQLHFEFYVVLEYLIQKNWRHI